MGELKPIKFCPVKYSKIKSNEIIIKVTSQNKYTLCFNLSVEISKKNLIARASKINLKKPITLNRLFSKLVLKNKLIIKDSHNKLNKTKYLFVKILNDLFLIIIIKKRIPIHIVFKLIIKLPNKKHNGYIAKLIPSKISKPSSFKPIVNFFNIIFD